MRLENESSGYKLISESVRAGECGCSAHGYGKSRGGFPSGTTNYGLIKAAAAAGFWVFEVSVADALGELGGVYVALLFFGGGEAAFFAA